MKGGLMRFNERGAALVEFAVASILFFTVLFGIIDFGQSIWRYNMMADLAQEGARWAAVRGHTSATLQATAADVQTYVQTRSPIAVTVNVTRTDTATSQCIEAFVDPQDLNPGEGFCVSVVGSWSRVTSLVPIASMTLNGRAQMIMAR
jgi:Flp pilus assembly protein TadG